MDVFGYFRIFLSFFPLFSVYFTVCFRLPSIEGLHTIVAYQESPFCVYAKRRKSARVLITLECTESRKLGVPPSRYYTSKNKVNTPERLELMKYNKYLRRHTLHKEINATGMSVSNEDKLSFYKYYKQAMLGDCNTSRPGLFQVQERYKWDAWDSVRGMSQESAKESYVQLLDKLSPKWRE
ncbi:Acyl-CoA-binding -like protein 3 [Babesia sp. Xinjiang]|uniref:Acyl-CoA-binding -like protein 3 n=1 Tax=Babesia sp. Xinjiang TaxID=462227 RepID=UPI000A22EF2E|nr:Acyl-CoA-binding -like protein 3 [Babesia sp. Xinjiang]ORM40475.1 Acyl-CoA-binding -like protein 3 [Babesia sp. Xinjiang]